MNTNSSSVLHIPLGMVNSYIIKGSKNVLVDTGNPGSEKAILDFMSSNGIKLNDISLIVITHGHSDHFGGVWELKEKTGAKVAIHRHDANTIRTGKNPPLYSRDLVGRIMAKFIKEQVPGFNYIEPDIIIENEMSLEDFGVEGKIILTPGHTNGSVSVALPTGELVVGDLITGGILKREKPQYSSYIEDMGKIKLSMQYIMKLSLKLFLQDTAGRFQLIPSIKT